MKKILYSVFALAMATFTLTSCEDVPMPYDDPNSSEGGSGGGGTVVVEPTGQGTVDDPYNVAAAINIVSALEGTTDASVKTDPIYVKGIITSISQVETSQYGNANYYISDDVNGTNKIYIFQSYYLGNKKFTSTDQIKEGDEVVVYGPFYNYQGNTPETVGKGSSYIYSLNGQTAGSDTPTDGLLNQDFSTSLGNFTSHSTSGSLTWYNDYKTAMITGYKDYDGDGVKENKAAVTYLVSPSVDLSTVKEAYVAINHAINYEKGDINANNSIVISKDYNGDVSKATWEQLNYDTDGLGSSWTFKDKTVAIPASYIGSKVVIALRHTCTDAASSTWEVASLAVKEGQPETGESGGSTGDTSTPNGDFETWVNNAPNNWTTSSTAGNATLSQSTDAHGGNYSVKVGGTTSANKRLGYKEIELKAGEYTMKFYVKAATSNGGSVRPGYVPVTDGKVGNYVYGDYVNDITNSEWIEVIHTFTLTADGTYSVVIMNSKKPGADVLIDDFTLTSGSTVIIK